MRQTYAVEEAVMLSLDFLADAEKARRKMPCRDDLAPAQKYTAPYNHKHLADPLFPS